jgi:hypothetical protein
MVSGINSSGGVPYNPPPSLNSEQKESLKEAAGAVNALAKQFKNDHYKGYDDSLYQEAFAKLSAAYGEVIESPKAGGLINAAFANIDNPHKGVDSCNTLLEIARQLEQLAQ